MIATWIIITIVVVVVLFAYIYNSLIRLRVRVNNAWSQIDVQLKRRYDLIPNLIKTVKGYMKHEKGVLEEVTKARASLMTGGPAKRAEASNQITEALKSIFAVAESYPDLKANEKLSGTESKIAYARQFYNDSVMRFNEAIQVFPKNLFASLFGFNKRDFFETKGKERDNVKVEF